MEAFPQARVVGSRHRKTGRPRPFDLTLACMHGTSGTRMQTVCMHSSPARWHAARDRMIGRNACMHSRTAPVTHHRALRCLPATLDLAFDLFYASSGPRPLGICLAAIRPVVIALVHSVLEFRPRASQIRRPEFHEQRVIM